MSELTDQPEFDDSLLSAYVDGELTADERALVEARLADDPQTRQLVAELETVSATVRSLPRAKVTEDVRAAVLQQLDTRSVPLQPSTLTMRKRLLWPLLATAALVMLMFYQPEGLEKEAGVARVENVQVNNEGAKANNESAPQVAASEEVPEVEAPAAPSLQNEGFANFAAVPSHDRSDLEQEMAADSAVDYGRGRAVRSLVSPESNVGLVHVTLTDLHSGVEHFNRLLVSNGIELIGESKDSPAEAGAGAATFRDSRLFSESSGGEVGITTRSNVESNDTKSPAAEMVLVEAPPEQIANFLFACNQDSEAIESLTIDKSATEVSGEHPSEQLEQYQKYERPSSQQAESQDYVVTPEQQGVITAINSLDFDSAGPPSAGPQPSQAWATKLRPDQSPRELQQLEEQIQSRRGQVSGELKRKDPKKDADSPQQMRVLFLLHPSETSEK